MKPSSASAVAASVLVLNEDSLPVIQIVLVSVVLILVVVLDLKEKGKNSFNSWYSVSSQLIRFCVALSPRPASLHFSAVISEISLTTFATLVAAVLPISGMEKEARTVDKSAPLARSISSKSLSARRSLPSASTT